MRLAILCLLCLTPAAWGQDQKSKEFKPLVSTLTSAGEGVRVTSTAKLLLTGKWQYKYTVENVGKKTTISWHWPVVALALGDVPDKWWVEPGRKSVYRIESDDEPVVFARLLHAWTWDENSIFGDAELRKTSPGYLPKSLLPKKAK